MLWVLCRSFSILLIVFFYGVLLFTLIRNSAFADFSNERSHCKIVECRTDYCFAGMVLTWQTKRLNAGFATDHAHTVVATT